MTIDEVVRLWKEEGVLVIYYPFNGRMAYTKTHPATQGINEVLNNKEYLDWETDQPFVKPSHCLHCQRPRTPSGADGCLGMIPNVKNACCGHTNKTNEELLGGWPNEEIKLGPYVFDTPTGPRDHYFTLYHPNAKDLIANPYVQFEDGTTLRDEEARDWFTKNVPTYLQPL